MSDDEYDSWYRRGYLDGLAERPRSLGVPTEYADTYRDGWDDGNFKRRAEAEDERT